MSGCVKQNAKELTQTKLCNTNLTQQAIAAFARRLTEGENGLIAYGKQCEYCCNRDVHDDRSYSCDKPHPDRDCPIRQAANLDKGGKG